MFSPSIKQSKGLLLGVFVCFAVTLFAQNPSALKAKFKANEIKVDHQKHPTFIEFQKGTNKQFFSEVKSNLLNNSGYDFKLKNQSQDQRGFTHERMIQTFNGIEIIGGEYVFHYKSDQLISANGKIQDGYALKTKPGLNESQALQIALKSISGQTYMWDLPEMESLLKKETNNPRATYFPKLKLVYTRKNYSSVNPLLLAYQLEVYSAKPLGRYHIEIDASTGEIINSFNKIHTSSVERTGKSKYNGDVLITVDSTGSTYRLSETTRGNGVNTYDLGNGWDYSNATIFTDSDGYFDGDDIAVSAHFGAQATYDLFAEHFGRNSYDDGGASINSYVHYYSNYANAFWDGQRMTYGDGDGDGYNMQALVSLDIVGHEITHAVTEYTAGLYYSYESGALNESFSDIFGQAVEYYAAPETASWNLADEIYLDGVSMIRSMSNPNQEGQPDTYYGNYWFSGSSDNGGVHYNSGVQNYWFYLLVEGGTGVNDNGFLYDVSGIGWDDAIQIAYRNLTVYLTSTSEYSDARAGAELAAIDLFGRNSVQYQTVVSAWDAVGVAASYPVMSLPDSVDLGVTLSGISKSGNFNIYNSGTGSISVYGMEISGDFELKSDSAFNISEGTGKTVILSSKSIETIGEVLGSVKIYSSLDTATVVLTMNVVEGPSIEITPEDFEFEVLYGDSQMQELHILNNSSYEVNFKIDVNNQGKNVTKYEKTDKIISNGKEKDFLYRAVSGLSGSQNESGYRWRDSDEGAIYNWYDITNLGTQVYLSDDSNTSFLDLGFDFEFFDDVYSQVSISSNGWLSFSDDNASIWNAPLPSFDAPPAVISWMANDLHPGYGNCYYYADEENDRFIVQYNNWSDYGNRSGEYTIQIQIYASGRVKLLYNKVLNPVNGTVGIQNGSRNLGITVSYNDGSFFRNQYAIEFSKGINWLELSSEDFLIGANSEMNIPITVNTKGLNAGEYEAELLLRLTDFGLVYDTLDVDLSVIGSPNLQAIDDVIFDTTLIGDTSYYWIPIVNIGSDELIINRITWNNTENFYVQDSLYVTIGAGESRSILAVFFPNEVGLISSVVSIHSNDPVDSIYNFSISGVGALPPVFVLSQDSIKVDLYTGGIYTEEIVLDNTSGGTPLIWEAKLVYITDNQSSVKKAPIAIYAKEALNKFEEPIEEVVAKGTIQSSGESNDILNNFPYRSRGMVNVGNLIYVADYNNYRVTIYDPEQQQTIGYFGTNSRPYAITYAEGYLWVGSSSGYVIGYTLTGSIVGSFYVPTNDVVAITFDGEYFLVTDQYESGPIYKLNFDGSIIETYTNTVTEGYIVAFQYAQDRLYTVVNNWNYGIDELQILELHFGSWTTIESVPLPVGTTGYGIGMDEENFYYAPYYNYSNELYRIENTFVNTWMELSKTAGTIPAGTSESITLKVDPGKINGGAYKGMIGFITNDPQKSWDEIFVTLNLTGAPDLKLDYDSLFLRDIFLGDSAYITLDIYNKGNDTLKIEEINLSHDAFQLVSNDSITLGPDESDVITLLWLPNAVGNNDALISIYSNDPDDSIHVVQIYANTLAAPVMVIEADSLSASLYSQRTSEFVITIDNSAGGSELTWNSELNFNSSASFSRNQIKPIGFYSKREKQTDLREPSNSIQPSVNSIINTEDVVDTLASTGYGTYAMKVVGDFIYCLSDQYLYKYSISSQIVVESYYLGYLGLSIEIADNKIFIGDLGMVKVYDMSLIPIGSFDLPSMDYYTIAYINGHVIATFMFGINTIYELELDGSVVNQFANPGIQIVSFTIANNKLVTLTTGDSQSSNIIYNLNFEEGGLNAEFVQNVALGLPSISFGYSNGYFYLCPEPEYKFFKINSHSTLPWMTLEPSSGVVPSGEVQQITLNIQSGRLSGGQYNGLISMFGDDPYNRQVQLATHLTIEESSRIVSSVDHLNFEQVFATDTSYLDFEIQNTGIQNLVINSIISDNSDYHIGEVPDVLGIGEKAIVEVLYIPTSAEVDNGFISIYSNDPIDSVLSITLIGEGIEPPVLVYAPDSIYHKLFVGDIYQDQLDLQNLGLSDLTYEISINSQNSAEFVGPWELYFSHYCDGSYGYIVLDFHEDHTYSDLYGYSFGPWEVQGNSLKWGFFNDENVYYIGKFEDDNHASGAYVHYGETTGCWFMNRYNEASVKSVFDTSISYLPDFKPNNVVGASVSKSLGQNSKFFYEGDLSGIISPESSVSGVITTDLTDAVGGVYEYVVSIRTNDPSHKKVNIPVRIEVAGFPELVLNTENYHFGTLFQNDTAYATFEISNVGSDVLVVDSIVWNNDDFKVISYDTTINAYSESQITILYQPAQVGIDSTVLTFFTNSTSGNHPQMFLTGEGAYAPVLKLDNSAISASLYTNGSSSHELLIDNSEGGNDLIWSANIRYLKDQEPYSLKSKTPIGFYSQRSKEIILNKDSLNVESKYNVQKFDETDSVYDFLYNSRTKTIVGNILYATVGSYVYEYYLADGFYTSYYLGYSCYGIAFAEGYFWVGDNYGTIRGYNENWEYIGDFDNPSYDRAVFDYNGEYFVFTDYAEVASIFHVDFDGSVLAQLPNPLNYSYVGVRGISIVEDNLLLLYGNDSYEYQIYLAEYSNGFYQIMDTVDLGISYDTYDGLAYADGNLYVSKYYYPYLYRYPYEYTTAWLSLSSYSGVIAADSTASINLFFEANKANEGQYYAVVDFYSNDPLNRHVEVPVELNVTNSGTLVLTDPIIEFGGVFVGDEKELQIEIQNKGKANLEISAVNSNHNDFIPVSSQITILPNAKKWIPVTFKPGSDSELVGNIIITSNDHNKGIDTVIVRGFGIAPPVMKVDTEPIASALYVGESTEVFIQIDNTDGKYDLNWQGELQFSYDGEESMIPIGLYGAIVDGEKEIAQEDSNLKVVSNLVFDSPYIDTLYNFSYYANAMDKVGDTIFVANSGYGRVDLYGVSTQSQISSFYVGVYPYAITVLDDVIWVSNSSGSTILGYDFNGSLVGSFNQSYNTSGISLTNDGEYLQIIPKNAPQIIYQVNNDGTLKDAIVTDFASTSIVQSVNHNGSMYSLIYLSNYGMRGIVSSRMKNDKYVKSDTLVLPDFWPSSFDIDNGKLYMSGLYTYEAYVLDVEDFVGLWAKLEEQSGVVNPGEVVNLKLKISAENLEAGDYTGSLEITSNDPLNPTANIPLSLTVSDGATISLNSGVFDFGDVFIGQSTKQQLIVSNKGSQRLNIASVSSNDESITISSNDKILEPGEETTWEITYEPTIKSALVDSLFIQSNDPNDSHIAIPLYGNSFTGPVVKLDEESIHVDLNFGEQESTYFTLDNSQGDYPLKWKASLKELKDFRSSISLANENNYKVVNHHYIDTINTLDRYISGLVPLGDSIYSYTNGRSYIDVYSLSSKNLTSRIYLPFQGESTTFWNGNLWLKDRYSYDYMYAVDFYGNYVNSLYLGYITKSNQFIYAASGEFLYIWNKLANNELYKIDLNGEIIETYQIPIDQLYPVAMAVEDGILYLVEEATDRVIIKSLIISEDKTLIPLKVMELTDFNSVRGVSVNEDQLYVAGYSDKKIMILENNLGLTWVTPNAWKGEVSAGNIEEIQLDFDSYGLNPGDYSAILEIEHNDPNVSKLELSLSMSLYSAPSIVTDLDTINFGDSFVGDSSFFLVNIQNVGNETLDIFEITTNSDKVNFENIVGSLNPGESFEIMLKYHSDSVDVLNHDLTIHSNDPNDAEFVLPILGGMYNPPVISVNTDTIYQHVYHEDSSTFKVRISNTEGGYPLDWQVYYEFENFESNDILPGFYGNPDFSNQKKIDLPEFKIDQTLAELDSIQLELEYETNNYIRYNTGFVVYNGLSFGIEYNNDLKWFDLENDVTVSTIYGISGSLYGFTKVNDLFWTYSVNSGNLLGMDKDGVLSASIPISDRNNEFQASTYDGNHFIVADVFEYDSKFQFIEMNGNVISSFNLFDPSMLIAIAYYNNLLYQLRSDEYGYVIVVSSITPTSIIEIDRIRIDFYDALYSVHVDAEGIWISSFYGRLMRFKNPWANHWLSLEENQNHRIEPGKTGIAEFKVKPAGLEARDYFANVVIRSNDPVQSEVRVPVHLLVSDVPLNSAPIMEDLELIIDENSTISTSIAQLQAYDKQKDTLTYEIISGDLSMFNLSSDGLLSLSGEPNFEQKSLYELMVTVSDGEYMDSANVYIHINDLNEMPGMYDTTFVVSEGDLFNFLVGQMVGWDEDMDSLSYSISSGNDTGMFSLNGDGSLYASGKFNFEENSLYSFDATISDGLLSTTSKVYIQVRDENDSPILDPVQLELMENSEVGILLTQLDGTDEDEDILTYAMADELASLYFELTQSGELLLKQSPDFETMNQIEFVVTVSDGSLTDTALVVISILDINEIPTLEDYQYSIDENTAVGSVIGLMEGEDQDSDLLTYQIIDGNIGDAFLLEDGKLSISSLIDYESINEFQLVVEVSDGFMTNTAKVNVLVNDVNEKPSLNGYQFQIPENFGANTEIGKITGTDPDFADMLTYKVINNSEFEMQGESLVLKTPVDFESRTKYEFEVVVLDQQLLSDTAAIVVTITDVNEAPVMNNFEFVIVENQPSGELLGQLTATDPESNPLKFAIIDGNSSKAFLLSTNGELYTSTSFDFEKQQEYTLTVTASDVALSDTATVVITIINVNESPTFEVTHFTIAENAEIGSSIGSMNGSDVDGDNIAFSIINGNDAGKFALSSSGSLQLIGKLNFEDVAQYTLEVSLSDGKLSTSKTVSIAVSDVNEAPEFEASSINIVESAAVNSIIGFLVGSDVDGDILNFSIIGGNEAGKFALSSSGSMQLVGALNFEEVAQYTLEVSLSDGKLSTSKTVSIAVSDVNEAPEFDQISYTFEIAEEISVGTTIGQLLATDADANTSLTYTLSNSSNDQFKITGDGKIQLAKALNYEVRGYQLEVSVTDGEITTKAGVQINVTVILGTEPVYSLVIYPNPAAHNFTVRSEELIQTLEIVDFSGKTILTHHVIDPAEGIDVSMLSSGMYLVRIKFRDGFEKIEKLQIRK